MIQHKNISLGLPNPVLLDTIIPSTVELIRIKCLLFVESDSIVKWLHSIWVVYVVEHGSDYTMLIDASYTEIIEASGDSSISPQTTIVLLLYISWSTGISGNYVCERVCHFLGVRFFSLIIIM